jgi:glycerol kinase
MPCILAIDQSTSASKAILYAARGEVLDQESVEHAQICPRPGWVEHDAEEIWINLQRAAGALIGRNAARIADLACVSITNQRETFVVIDGKTGQPLCNAIVWQCRRGEPVCSELVEAGHDDEVRRKTGLRIDTYFSGPKLSWLLENQPDIAKRIRDGSAKVATIDAYLVHRLTNGAVFATDHTNASRTLLYDIRALDWCDRLCELFGVPRHALPEIRDSSDRFGETDLAGLLPRRVPISGVIGDSQAALFAQRCFRPGDAKVTYGTGSSVLLNVGDEAPEFVAGETSGGAVTSLAWTLRGRPTYCVEGIINYSAATLAWLRDRLGVITDFAEAEPLARSVDDNGGVYLVPAFAGMGAPHWRADARAAIVGLSAHSGRAHVVRAALESIAYQIRDVLDMLRTQSGVDLSVIHADGGPTANRFLMQFTADVCGIDVDVSTVSDCSALGAAMMGALGTGIYRSLDEIAALPRPSTAYRPQMDAERVREFHAGWTRAVEQVIGRSSTEHSLV